MVILPDQTGPFPHILVEAGKEGNLYVINRDQMTTNNSHYLSGADLYERPGNHRGNRQEWGGYWGWHV